MDLRLRPLRLDDEAVVRAAHEALAPERFPFAFLDDGEDWPTHVRRSADHSRGVGLGPGKVPATFLLATVGGEVVGRASIRHELNDFLLAIGGHVGYAVLPQHRRRGYATEILRQSLVVARSLGVDEVLVTCDDTNVGSAAVIERCGGVLEDVRPDPDGGPPKRRYWIR